MDDTDDYESEILFYSLNQQKRERNKLMRQFGFVVLSIVILFIVLLLLDQNRSNVSERSPLPVHLQQRCSFVNYDYLQLSLHWPPSVCLFRICKEQPVGRWVISGLLPAFYNDTNPKNCCSRLDFNYHLFEQHLPLLNRHWPALQKDQTNLSVWEQNWFKYGSCAGGGIGGDSGASLVHMHNEPVVSDSAPLQVRYFDAVVHIAQLVGDMRTVLALKNLSPQVNALMNFNLSSMNAVVSHNHTAVLRCVKYTNSRGKSFYLLDTILMCFDRYTLAQIDCPNMVENCPENVLYPDYGINFNL